MLSYLNTIDSKNTILPIIEHNQKENPFEYEIIIDNPRLCELIIRGAELELINKFRRAIIRSVETLAIDKVIIEVNSTVIPGEIISHRLGLLPIKAETKLFDSSTNLEDKEEKIISFTLESTGDLYHKKKITSEHIKFEGECKVVGMSPFLIQYLHPGETIRIKGFVKKGKGSQHSKWCPVSSISFIELNPRVFRFRFENSGQLSNKEILQKGLYALIKEG